MRYDVSPRVLVCCITVTLLIFMGMPSGVIAQQEGNPCKGLKTPRAVSEEYFKGNYKAIFPCLAGMIETHSYTSGTKVLKDQILPVLDHYFTNFGDKESEYDLGKLLSRIMVKPRDDSGAKVVKEFEWSKRNGPVVSTALKQFNKPTGFKIEPEETRIKKGEKKTFKVTYQNEKGISLTSLPPDFSATIEPEGKGSVQKEGGSVVVTCLKAGKKPGTLVITDKKLKGTAQFTCGGRMNPLWWIGGLVITGGAAAGAATTDDDGTATTLWAVTGVSAVVTTDLFYKYLRGEGVPFLSESDANRSDDKLAVRFVPERRTLELNVRF